MRITPQIVAWIEKEVVVTLNTILARCDTDHLFNLVTPDVDEEDGLVAVVFEDEEARQLYAMPPEIRDVAAQEALILSVGQRFGPGMTQDERDFLRGYLPEEILLRNENDLSF